MPSNNNDLLEDLDQELEVKDAIPVSKNVHATLEQLKKFNDVNIYGFLLNPDPKHPVAQVLKERWSEIHYLTGEKVMLVVTEAPKEWSDNLKNYWRRKLGDDFKNIWREWQKKPDAGIAFQYMDILALHNKV
ncbi:MAG: hypothetical protein LVT47_06715 [Cyanobacteria bacterium LVE1205-1]|jgi:hypothetical protein